MAACYPRETEGFAAEVMALLDAHHAVLDGSLRRALVQALILMRKRGQARIRALARFQRRCRRRCRCGAARGCGCAQRSTLLCRAH